MKMDYAIETEDGKFTIEQLQEMIDTISDCSDLPSALIIANVDDEVFVNAATKEMFERLFLSIDAHCIFRYIRSFHRVRVEFISPELAVRAKLAIHNFLFCNKQLRCYLAQLPFMNDSDEPAQIGAGKKSTAIGYLRPPLPTKQFLISPPSSPPVGWEPCLEDKPVINELVSALNALEPGSIVELHSSFVENQPSVVVHVCEADEVDDSIKERDDEEEVERIRRIAQAQVRRIVQTKCPPREANDNTID